jgi:4-azaleucine resistance transporter AzlC
MSEPAREERTHRDGVRAVAPLAVAVLGFGVSFGVLARAAGMGGLAPIVMSMATFAGSAQFASASILDTGGTVAAAITAAALLNARYGPIGVSVASSLTGSAWSRFLHAQLTVDETWAVAAEGHGHFNTRVLLGAGVTLYLAWVVGTALGVAFGDVIGDPGSWGLDAAFPALFLALLVPQLTGRRETAAAVLGAGIALALTPFTPAGVPIVAAAAACLIGLRPADTAEDPDAPDGPDAPDAPDAPEDPPAPKETA